MAFENTNGLSAADVAAVMGNNGGMNMDGNGGWWLIVLFLFLLSGRNGFNGGGDGVTQSEFQNGLNMQSLQSGQDNILQQLANNALNLQNNLSTIAMALQQNGNTAQSAIADLKYTVATEGCADRNAISQAIRDVLEANNNSTQRILDQMCQDKIDAKNEEIARLRTELNMAALNASQNAQTAQILSDNARQTTALEQYLNPTPIPAYVVQNPNCCGQVWSGCGCNS